MRTLGRPSGTTDLSARERIMAEAFALFYADGIRAVGVDLLIARSGVAKATFYRHFASKNDLVLAYLDRRRAAMLDWLVEAVAERTPEPAERLLAVFDAVADLCADPAFRGCPVHNTVVESDTAEVRQRARAHQADLERYVAGLATEARADEPERLASRWVLLLDGTLAGAHRAGGAESDVADAAAPAAVARRIAEQFLSGAGVPAGR
jgi:AcrR family transcriptional regulator